MAALFREARPFVVTVWRQGSEEERLSHESPLSNRTFLSLGSAILPSYLNLPPILSTANRIACSKKVWYKQTWSLQIILLSSYYLLWVSSDTNVLTLPTRASHPTSQPEFWVPPHPWSPFTPSPAEAARVMQMKPELAGAVKGGPRSWQNILSSRSWIPAHSWEGTLSLLPGVPLILLKDSDSTRLFPFCYLKMFTTSIFVAPNMFFNCQKIVTKL